MVIVRVKKRGPLLVEGPFELRDAEGRAVPLENNQRVALCRCGASRCKPFCDGSHHRVAFDDAPPQEDP